MTVGLHTADLSRVSGMTWDRPVLVHGTVLGTTDKTTGRGIIIIV